ncbi:MAG: dihydropteroate synthase [Chloroflexota bacterium]
MQTSGPFSEIDVTTGRRTQIMGVVNVTPDSFSGDGVSSNSTTAAVSAARQVADGADMIDVGGESTRPGATPVSEQEELRRVLPAVAAIVASIAKPVSVDTTKPSVAERSLQLGAAYINDVSGSLDPELASIAARAGAGMILVHHGLPDPGTDLLSFVRSGLVGQVTMAVAAGVPVEQLYVDPGFGIGKTWRANLELIRRLDELRVIGVPLLVGVSRKGMIGRVLGVPLDDRLEGTAALISLCIVRGASAVRVHDVRYMSRVVLMTDALMEDGTP